MKKTKKIKILTTIGLCFIAGLSNVKALEVHEYNGASAPAGVSGGTCNGLSNVLCRFGRGYNGIRVGVVHYDATTGKYTRFGKPIDVWDKPIFNGREVLSSTWRSLKFENAITLPVWSMRPGYNYAVNPGIGSYNVAHGSGYAAHLKKYFMTSTTDASGKKQWPVIDEYLTAMGTSREKLASLGLVSETYGLNKSGFRIFIEPIKPYMYNNRFFVMTLTEAARMEIPMSIGTAWKEENSLLFTTWDDVGIKAPTTGQVYATGNYGKSLTAQKDLGLSLHIIDMTEAIQKPCEYTDPSNFPTDAATTDRQCCTYYETDENYKKIPGYTEGMTKEQALELLYKDYPHCRIEDKCTIDLLPTLSSETNPSRKACCESLLEQYKDNSVKISQINKYCKTEKAGTACDESDYTVNVDTPVSCTESTTGTISDITDWKCIFDSTNQSDSFKYNKFYLVESTKKNPYCSVYCREDINYEFPTNNISVEAGKHFTVNNGIKGIASWDPINFTNKRECRTTSSISNPVHIQMDVDAGYKKLYNAIQAYKNYISNLSNRNDRYYYYSNKGRGKYYGCEYDGYDYFWMRDEYDCSRRDRLLDNIYDAARSARCTAQCDYETIEITVPRSGWSSSTTTREYTIGYNYLVSGKINVEQFIQDWNKWNDKVDPNWEGWKINQQFNSNKECESIEYRCPHTRCSGSGEDRECETYYTEHTGKSCKTYAYYDSNNDGTPEKHTASGRDSCHGDVPDWAERARNYKKKYEEAVEERKKAEDYIWSCNDWEKFKETGTSSNIKSSKYAYSGSFSQFLKYDKFSPDLTLNYNNSDWIYYYNDLLDKTLQKQQVSIDTTYYKFATKDSPGYTYSSSLNEIFKNKYQTNRGKEYPLGQVEYIYPINEEARSEIEKAYSYHLPDEQYQYILKPQGLSVNEKPTDEEQEYINLGYTNLPVHFMTPEGSYPITLTYNKFSEKENLEHKFDDFVFGTNRNKSLVYSCNYYVDNNIIDNPGGDGTNPTDPNPDSCEEKCGSDTVCLEECNKCIEECAGDQNCIDENCLTGDSPDDPDNPYDPTTPGSDALSCILRCNGDQSCIERCPKCIGQHCVSCTGPHCDDWRGLAVIYRPISLENPFPGIDGETREPGSNWKHTKVNIAGETKYLYISNNRNVSESEIYAAHVEPMYSFTLTPAVIMRIRNYNDSNSYGDFNMKCLKETDGMWKECKSNFLRNQAGTGTGWQVQLGNNRAQSWIDWDTCGMQDNWDACALEDEERS